MICSKQIVDFANDHSVIIPLVPGYPDVAMDENPYEGHLMASDMVTQLAFGSME